MDSRCCTQHSIFPLTDQERGACEAALHLSQHTKIELLPNVHINEKSELSGFHFEAAGCDLASVLPIPTNMFDCIVAYEVLSEQSSSFNEKVIHILMNLQEYKDKLAALMAELQNNTTNLPSFQCMPEDNDDENLKEEELIFAKHSCDRQVWDDQPPNKVGLFHSFVRPHTKDSIEHRLIITIITLCILIYRATYRAHCIPERASMCSVIANLSIYPPRVFPPRVHSIQETRAFVEAEVQELVVL